MATANEIFATTGLEEQHFVIDSHRRIHVPKDQKRIAVQYDHNIETVTFDCPRYWDGHDMSMMKVYLNYMLSNGVVGSYHVDTVTIDDVDNSIMHFDWTVSGHVTQAEGNLTFLVCIVKVNEDGIEETHWNSELNSETHISKGLENFGEIIAANADIITQLLTRMDQVEFNGVSNERLVDTVNTYFKEGVVDKTLTMENRAADASATGEAIDEVAQSVTEVNTAMSTAITAETNARKAEIDVERKRIDAFTALGEGSTTGDAELVDARVGYDGTVHDNVGNAIRAVGNDMVEISGLAIEEIDTRSRNVAVPSVNMYNCKEVNAGYYNTSLDFKDDANTFHTHPIFVIKGVTYKWLAYPVVYGSANSNLVIKVSNDGSLAVLDRPSIAEDDTITWTATETCRIILNVGYKHASSMMFTKADEYPSEFTEYGVVLNDDIDLGLNVTKDETEFFVNTKSENLFDKSNVISGYYMKPYDGTLAASAGKSVAYVPLLGIGTYSQLSLLRHFGAGSATKIPAFDSNKQFVEYITAYGEDVDYTAATGVLHYDITYDHIFKDISYVGYTVRDADLDIAMVVKSATYPESYIPFIDYWTIPSLLVNADQISGIDDLVADGVDEVVDSGVLNTNHLYGKSIVFDGDSICHATAETTETTNRGWAYRVGHANGMDWYNEGISGGTITAEVYTANGGARHWVSRNVDSIYENHPTLDYYVFEGGTNDADLLKDQTESWGEFSETDFSGNYDDTTFCGAFESLIYKVLNYYPNIKIGYIVAQKMGRSSTGYGENYNRYKFFTMAMQICKKWGIPYLNLWDESPLNPMLPSHFNNELDAAGNKAAGSLYTDGQHLTAAGYEIISSKIDAFVKSL